MRVLHITSGNLYGGVETFLATLLREAAAAPDMHPEFAVCFDGRFSLELESMGHSPRRLGPAKLSHPRTVLRARRALSQVLARGQYDVVVCHQPWSCVLFASVIRTAGLPVVMWVHMASNGGHWLERLCRLARPDVVICNSRFTAACTERWLPHAALEHVHCALSAILPGSREQRSRTRRLLDTGERDVVITQISRLESWKGQRVLLSALGALRETQGWTCWLVGGAQRSSETRYLLELKALARTLRIEDRVRFLGERDDVPAVLSASDIFCQPNIAPEPFGLALVEAQQAGLPVVTSGIGGALEIVDGSCGVLCAPGDVKGLVSALERLVVDHSLRARLGIDARRRADELCNATRQILRIEVVLARTLVAPQALRQGAVEVSLR
jgi:glycosyltransferase involved in cell wall biosynthesis